MWQLHCLAVDAGADHNAAEKYIANPDEKNDGETIFRLWLGPMGALPSKIRETAKEDLYRK
jgi:hypothetical protein